MSENSVTFADIIRAASQVNAGQPLSIPEGWGQGRATFGGLVAAVLYTAMERALEQQRLVRSLSLSFVGPVAPGPVELRVEILREGRGVTQVEGRLLQNDQVMAVMLGSFGAARESSVRVEASPAPEVKAPANCPRLPYIPKVIPEFTQQFEFGWAVGGLPFSGTQSRDMGGWVRLKNAPEAIAVEHVLALVDAWPPAVLPMLKGPAPASSLCWTIEFVQPLPAAQAQDWFLYIASVDHAQDGYGHIQAKFWSPQGELIALSRQTVTVFG